MTPTLAVLAGMAVGALLTWVALRTRRSSTAGDPSLAPATRLEAHLATASPSTELASAKSTALQRDAQRVVERTEATHDLEVLDRLLVDIRDLAGGEEAIFWRWVESRQTLVPSAWSTDSETRPLHFDVRAWGPLLRWSAEEQRVQVPSFSESPGNASGPPRWAARRNR